MKHPRRRRIATGAIWVVVAVAAVALLVPMVATGFPGDVRLSNDTVASGGYVSAYTLATGISYTDAVLDECSIAGARQNEPAVEIDPRDPSVLIGSSNDYGGVYAGSTPGNYVPAGPIWLGYYRSENGGASFQSSLVPGYPGDTSPYAALAKIRTASAGDPVIAWDREGRVFMGAESSDDPSGSLKTFGDVWVATFDNPGGVGGDTLNDGKRFVGSTIVGKGSSAPYLLGKFNDKTSIEADRSSTSATKGNVYFAWSRFTGVAGDVSIFLSRSTDHGKTWSAPLNLTPNIHDVQFPDIAVTGNGNVYVTFRRFSGRGGQTDAVMYVKSTDGGKSFSRPKLVTGFTPYDAQDLYLDGSMARDGGDFGNEVQSGYTFFRRDTQVRAAADASVTGNENVYIVFDATKPGTEVDTGTTYGSIAPGTGSQSGIYFVRLNGATGAVTTPALIDDQLAGHQLFPDIAVSGGRLSAIWWDSRNDPSYSPARPVGNDANGVTGPSLDVFAASSTDGGATWAAGARLTDVSSNPNYEQFSDRTVPFAGDYLWVSAVGSSVFGVWTDWRDTRPGTDPREAASEDNDNADVWQSRTFDSTTGTWSGDQVPHEGGLDQNIYGSLVP